MFIFETNHWRLLPPPVLSADIVTPLTGIFGDRQKAITDSIYRCLLDSWAARVKVIAENKQKVISSVQYGVICLETLTAEKHTPENSCDFILPDQA